VLTTALLGAARSCQLASLLPRLLKPPRLPHPMTLRLAILFSNRLSRTARRALITGATAGCGRTARPLLRVKNLLDDGAASGTAAEGCGDAGKACRFGRDRVAHASAYLCRHSPPPSNGGQLCRSEQAPLA